MFYFVSLVPSDVSHSDNFLKFPMRTVLKFSEGHELPVTTTLGTCTPKIPQGREMSFYFNYCLKFLRQVDT